MIREMVMERTRESRRGCLWAVIVLQSLALLVVFSIVVGLVLVGISLNPPMKRRGVGKDEYPDLKEVWSYGAGQTKVVRIPLQGMIFLGKDDGLFSSVMGSSVMALKSIRRATHDPDARAIILEINSGGGGITASDVIYNALLDFKAAQKGRKVIAVFGDTAASGAYYVALAADHIIAHPTTVTGSIGALMQTLNIRGLGEKIGVKDVTIKSGKDKDILNPFGELTLEQREMLQALVDEFHNRFVSLVASGRNLSETTVRSLANGEVFTASRALKLGLIDQIGYWENAMSKTAEFLHVDNVKVYRYEEEFSFSGFLKAVQPWKPTVDLVRKISRTRLLYLWQL